MLIEHDEATCFTAAQWDECSQWDDTDQYVDFAHELSPAPSEQPLSTPRFDRMIGPLEQSESAGIEVLWGSPGRRLLRQP